MASKSKRTSNRRSNKESGFVKTATKTNSFITKSLLLSKTMIDVVNTERAKEPKTTFVGFIRRLIYENCMKKGG